MLKRFTDIVISFIGLILLSLPLVFFILLIRVRMGSPVFFRQMRPALHGKPFTMIKFRTMLHIIGPDGVLLPDAERLTPLGRFLRATSIDELPELWNVLKGDMSLVGPRPLLMNYLSLYSAEQARRHDLRPGITGWAQVNGRNALGWEDKFALDTWYVDNYGFILDMKILLMTLLKVLRREGINADGEATMTKFQGTSQQ